MYDFNNLYGVHIEFTSRCNLLCPQCARVKDGKVNPDLPLENMSLETIERIFTELKNKIEYVHICGNYGDIIAHPYPLEAIDIIQNSGEKFIKMYTNGSARPKIFWSNLGKKLSGNKGQVVFSIDGFHDTNHLYRVNSNFNKIIENAKSFIDAGGSAVWEWLPFEHNDHQVEDAIKLSKRLGFDQFILKKNPRFSPINNGEHHTLKPSKIYIHEGVKKQERMIMGETQQLIPTLFPIKCKYHARKMIFIDFQGYVLPCCWHGNRFNSDSKTGSNEFHKIMQGYDPKIFNVNYYSIEEILNNDWYKKDMEYTIKILNTCRKHCTLGNKMSNKDNRIVHTYNENFIDNEPWE
jgi:MoaA/NifB/PqqE/SkfB family radical SAM enzyme